MINILKVLSKYELNNIVDIRSKKRKKKFTRLLDYSDYVLMNIQWKYIYEKKTKEFKWIVVF